MRAMHDLPVMHLYDAITDANNNAETLVATVIRGEHTGEKALILDGKMTWNSSEDGVLRKHEKDVTAVTESGVINLGGEDVFIELLGNEKQVVICGAGHVAMPIVSITRMMGMNVTVIDDREEFCENARKRGANRVICKPFGEAMAEIEGNDDTFFVVVTRGHRYDKDCVGGALRKKHAYVGMIGSKRHSTFVKENLMKEGLSEELVNSIYTPIGLNIGAETPEEIAVAIVAELIEVKNRKKRNFGFPKDVMKAIMDDKRDPMILATIVARAGSAPRAVGSKMLVRKDGTIVGTIGGGSAEGEIMKYSRQLLEEGFKGTELRHVDMACSAEEDGMVCGGVVDVLLETV
ncbi:MAG: XdhC family protein [Mogibacterium sp.]|nr:XdhC family protein [Mogibacterium sp.]